jgi:hypothetical protein
MIFLFGGKKSIREMLIKAINEVDIPTFVKREIESALMDIDTELEGGGRKKFEAAYKTFDKTKEGLVRVLDSFILIKRSQGAGGLEFLASINERIRASKAL